jgi:hypothetical protein
MHAFIAGEHMHGDIVLLGNLSKWGGKRTEKNVTATIELAPDVHLWKCGPLH